MSPSEYFEMQLKRHFLQEALQVDLSTPGLCSYQVLLDCGVLRASLYPPLAQGWGTPEMINVCPLYAMNVCDL